MENSVREKTYNFVDRGFKKFVNLIISISPLFACWLVVTHNGWTADIVGVVICVLNFYYTKAKWRKDKIRIRKLSINDPLIEFAFFYKKKSDLTLNESDFDVSINETQIIFAKKDSMVIGIAIKGDLHFSQNWRNLVNDLTNVKSTN